MSSLLTGLIFLRLTAATATPLALPPIHTYLERPDPACSGLFCLKVKRGDRESREWVDYQLLLQRLTF